MKRRGKRREPLPRTWESGNARGVTGQCRIGRGRDVQGLNLSEFGAAR
jgi:hypothetical protein